MNEFDRLLLFAYLTVGVLFSSEIEGSFMDRMIFTIAWPEVIAVYVSILIKERNRK